MECWLQDSDDEDDLLYDDESLDQDRNDLLELFDSYSEDEMLLDNLDILQDEERVKVHTSSRADAFPPLPAISKIESVFESIADFMLAEKGEIALPLFARPSNRTSNTGQKRGRQTSISISFPGKTPQDTWRFTAFIRVLELMHEALVDGVVTTKRDVFYKDPSLFKKQSIVDRIVDDIAYSFELPRAALNVVAAAKGLIAGAITIWRNDKLIVDGRADSEGSLIPNVKDTDWVDMSSARWILVIEKEAVFSSILSTDFWGVIADHGILITGKGYPDIATRGLLSRIANSAAPDYQARPFIHCLVDHDPDGIAILSTYRHGSAALRHENAALAVPSVRWLGIRSSDLASVQGSSESQALLPLSSRDRRKAAKMLSWEHLSADAGDVDLRTELQIMLMLNHKADIQLLDTGMGVASWLKVRLEA